jgi:hypothetical protein
VSRRLVPAGVLAAGAALVACFELSGPPSGLSSISAILAAWPAVAVGDALRDSTGEVAPLRVAAYDADGDSVTDATVTFIALDTGLHVDAAGVVHGDNVRSTAARIVAQVSRGGDVLQTPVLSIGVVPRPDSVAPTQDTTFAAKSVPIVDPAPITSDPLAVKVLRRGSAGAAPAGVQFWVVRYEIVDWPPGVDDQRTAYFSGRSTALVSVDTTDPNGVASRTIELQRTLLENAPAGTRQDVVVRATIRDAGSGGGVATITFVLPFVRE